MTLQDIEGFLAVIQKGNLTEAAQALNISQPTLTHRLKSLENELGASLIKRNKGVRTIEMTDTGRGFVPIAEKWARLWKETMNMAIQSKRQSLWVATTTTLGSYVMPEVYARFINHGYPITLDIDTLHSEGAYAALENNNLDIAFVARTMPSKRISAVPVFSERMVLLCRSDSPCHGQIHPSDLPVGKSVHLYWTHEYSLWHEYWFGANSYSVDADNMILAERIIATSDLWMIAPLTAASVAVKRGGLKILELKDGPPDRIIYSLTHSSSNQYAKLLTEELLSTVKTLGI